MSTRGNLFVSLVLFASFGAPAGAQPLAPGRLRCEWLAKPRSVQTSAPRFSWEVSDPRRGALQKAYEIHVSAGTTGAADMWSSGHVESRDSIGVVYAGAALHSGTRYYWTVRTWDADGKESPWATPASFSTGLATPADWSSSWIGDQAPEPATTPARNGFHSQFADHADTTRWVTLDLGKALPLDGVCLWPAQPFDAHPDKPGFCFPLRYRLEACDEPGFGKPVVLADRTGEDAPDPKAEPVRITFPRAEARYVRLTATRLREARQGKFALALAEMQALVAGAPVEAAPVVTASDSIDNGIWAARNLADGDLHSHNAQGWDALPGALMRKEFRVSGQIKRAVLYVTALGVYEARLNGMRVGDQQLAPEWTDYGTRVQYQAYDVADLLTPGANAIGVFLGDGWYAGRLGMAQSFTPNRRPRAVYGRCPRLRAQLQIELVDGSTQTVGTDGTWMTTTAGPIRSSDLLDGETYDARNEMPGFDRAGYVSVQNEPLWFPAKVDQPIAVELDGQANEPIRAIQEITPVALTEPTPGVFVFDLGQNMPGHCRIKVKGKSGATLTLRHVEAVNDDGTIYTPNLRGAPQVDRYTLRGDPAGETWEPRFTYHGFRFVEWSGEVEKPTLESLRGVVVCTDAPLVGTFECSSPMLNKLWSNILWTQHANMMSVPTDCPQRDERLGWMGDILAFAQTACFNKDMAAFIDKWSRDIRDAQADDGRFPDIAPHPYGKNDRFTGVPAWGDAGVFVPWAAYQNYADKRLLEEHFGAARRWVDWIHAKNPDLIWRNARHNDYNDWLNGDTLIADGWPRKGAEIPRDVFATAFFARSAWIVGEMARALGREAEAREYQGLFEQIRAAFIKEFVGEHGAMPGDTQAGYALALGFGLLPAELRTDGVANLVRGIEQYQGHLSTGFHSSHHAMLELTRAGRGDLAYQLVNNTTFPSWGYSIQNGSTTIWERWDGYVKGRGFQDPGMNSLNHWALGSVGEWMMRTIVGINPDEHAPGWSHFELRPLPGGGLTWAKGSYHSCRGKIESSWTIEGNATVYELTVPANTTARLWLADAHPDRITESGKPVREAPGVRVLPAEPTPNPSTDHLFGLELAAGKYSFRVGR